MPNLLLDISNRRTAQYDRRATKSIAETDAVADDVSRLLRSRRFRQGTNERIKTVRTNIADRTISPRGVKPCFAACMEGLASSGIF
jgi:hypothetical protein